VLLILFLIQGIIVDSEKILTTVKSIYILIGVSILHLIGFN